MDAKTRYLEVRAGVLVLRVAGTNARKEKNLEVRTFKRYENTQGHPLTQLAREETNEEEWFEKTTRQRIFSQADR